MSTVVSIAAASPLLGLPRGDRGGREEGGSETSERVLSVIMYISRYSERIESHWKDRGGRGSARRMISV